MGSGKENDPEDKSKGSISETTDDYSLRKVPESSLQSTADIALTRMGFTVSSSDLLFGYTIGLFFPFWQAIGIAFTYSTIIAFISILMGLIGYRERTSFALSSRFAFGKEGSILPSIIMVAIIAGFYGYILGITVDVFPKGGNLALLGYSVILGAIYLIISGLGFKRGLKWMARVGVPLMLLLVVVADATIIFHVHGFGAILSAVPKNAGKLALPTIIGLGVAKWLGGATVTPDLMRFGKNQRAVYITTIMEFLVGNFGFNFLGLILGLGLGVFDLGKAFGLLGLSALAIVTFIIQSITVEMNELYAASLALSNALRVKRFVSNLAVGIIGIFIGWYGVSQGIITSFLTFIGYISYALPIIPGIMIADYYIVRKMHYPEGLEGLIPVNWRAIVAFLITLLVNVYLGLYLKDTFWHSTPLISFFIYIILSIPQTVKSWTHKPLQPQTD